MSSYRYCDGIKRRDLLQIGALSALGLTLPDWLRLRAAQAADLSSASPSSPSRGGAGGGVLLLVGDAALTADEVAALEFWIEGGGCLIGVGSHSGAPGQIGRAHV